MSQAGSYGEPIIPSASPAVGLPYRVEILSLSGERKEGGERRGRGREKGGREEGEGREGREGERRGRKREGGRE